MTWSLALKNGDLSIDGRAHSLAVVRDESKLIQDLKSALLHKQGDEPTASQYGSTLEGGVSSDGIAQSGYIGRPITPMLILEIEEEIRRVLTEHQHSQVLRAKSDESTYGRITLSRGEILLNIGDVIVDQTDDLLSINIYLQTGSGSVMPIPMLFS